MSFLGGSSGGGGGGGGGAMTGVGKILTSNEPVAVLGPPAPVAPPSLNV